MDFHALINQYGYFTLIVGTFLGGETVLILAGYAAHAGYLRFELVMFFGALGVFCSDQFCFYMGRFCGRRILCYFPKITPLVKRSTDILAHRHSWFIIGFQFVPGTSTVTPIALGMSKVNALRFLILDLVGIALWTWIFTCFGCVLCNLRKYGIEFLILFTLIVLALWWFRRNSKLSLETEI